MVQRRRQTPRNCQSLTIPGAAQSNPTRSSLSSEPEWPNRIQPRQGCRRSRSGPIESNRVKTVVVAGAAQSNPTASRLSSEPERSNLRVGHSVCRLDADPLNIPIVLRPKIPFSSLSSKSPGVKTTAYPARRSGRSEIQGIHTILEIPGVKNTAYPARRSGHSEIPSIRKFGN